MASKIYTFPLVLISALVLAGCNGQGVKESEEVAVQTQEQEQKQEQAAQGEGEAFVGKLKDAMALGKTMKCTWEKDANNSGTTYVKGENVYGEMITEGKKSYMIMKDECLFTWDDSGEQGLKVCSVEPTITADETEEAEDVTAEAGEMDGQLPEDINYDCKVAIFGDEKFSPPAKVNFMDLGEMFQNQLGQ